MKYISGNKRMKTKDARSRMEGLTDSPYNLGRLSGRMAQVMVQAAQDFIAQEIDAEVRKNFRATIHQHFESIDSKTDPH